jgi:lipopolysaccharide exporter
MTASTSGPGRHMLRGSAWMIGLRWSMRLSGIASTMILARLLSPGDFGIIAIAMLVVGLLETLGETGERLALIRLPALERGHYDTAFTIQLLVGLTIGIGLFLLAPLSEHYFHEPRAVAVIRVLALRAIIGGLENIGTVDFRRDFRFGAAYALTMRAKVVSLIATVALAALTHSYWALAAGILINQCAVTLLSYVLHPYRPGLSFIRAGELCGFSGWTMLRSLGLYMSTQVDQLAVGGFAGAGSLGRYAVAADLATSPTTEIHEPIIGVFYPVLSRCQDDREKVRDLFLRVFGWSVVICAATAVGLAAIAHDYRLLVLGPQWSGVEGLIPWLAIAAAISCLGSGADALFDMLGMPQRSARLQWLRLLLLAVAVGGAAAMWHDLRAIAMARLAALLLCIPITLISAARLAALPLSAYAALLWRPWLAAAAMLLAVWSGTAALAQASLWRLAITIPCGGLAYCGTLLLLWRAVGQPHGPETDIAASLRTARAWLRARFSTRNIGYL